VSRGDERSIGIFDSGVGGLTVVDAITKLLPQEHLIYFGDNARCPYGPRPVDQVRGFAFEIMEMMAGYDVKMLVIACNSMTAAYEQTGHQHHLPVVGMIDPAVRAAVRASHNGRIGVLGTRSTISTGRYEAALQAASPDVAVYPQVCEGFVERVEMGDTFSPELFALAERYLAPLQEAGVDTLILGCTHYPLLKGVLHSVTGGRMELISSAEEAAKDIYAKLVERGLLRTVMELGTRRFLTSGDPRLFREVGSRFLTGLEDVEHVATPALVSES
jgi:glutamate racemase